MPSEFEISAPPARSPRRGVADRPADIEAPSKPVASSNGWQGAVDMLSLVGNTPLLRLNKITRECPGVEIFAKAEWFNPGGSVKDRPALNIVREAEKIGLMSSEKVLLDSTSGNTGIAYAMICAARGYRAKLFMPSNVSLERKRILRAYGAEIVYTDPMERSGGCEPPPPKTPVSISTRTSTTIRRTGRLITTPLRRRSLNRRKDG